MLYLRIMFDRESHKEQLRLIMKQWTEAQIDEHTDYMAAKYLTVRKGPNVVHLDYFGSMLDADELVLLNNKLADAALELSSFDKSGIPYNSLQDFSLQAYIAISASVLGNLLSGIGPNAAWDAIKCVTVYTWHRFRKIKTIGSKQSMNFGLKVNIGNGNGLELKLDGDFSEETALKALDKGLKLMRDFQPKEKPQFSNFHVFDPETGEWAEIDVMAAIRATIAANSKTGEA